MGHLVDLYCADLGVSGLGCGRVCDGLFALEVLVAYVVVWIYLRCWKLRVGLGCSRL